MSTINYDSIILEKQGSMYHILEDNLREGEPSKLVLLYSLIHNGFEHYSLCVDDIYEWSTDSWFGGVWILTHGSSLP